MFGKFWEKITFLHLKDILLFQITNLFVLRLMELNCIHDVHLKCEFIKFITMHAMRCCMLLSAKKVQFEMIDRTSFGASLREDLEKRVKENSEMRKRASEKDELENKAARQLSFSC